MMRNNKFTLIVKFVKSGRVGGVSGEALVCPWINVKQEILFEITFLIPTMLCNITE